MNRDRINKFFSKIPTHFALIFLCLIWLVPTLGLLVTSFRPQQAANESGWWTVFSGGAALGAGSAEYQQFCEECHGADGQAIAEADLTNPEVTGPYMRSARLLGLLREEIDGEPHMGDLPLPSLNEAAAITEALTELAGAEEAETFTINNYVDALVGYRQRGTYLDACEDGTAATYGFRCNISDVLNPRGMGRAFVNSMLVTIPATILPLLFAAFAGYAFSWLDFPGRLWLFALLVGLQVVPLQMTLVPISRIYAQLGLNGTFLGVWLFHTGFGMPYAIYLMRNFLGGLPRDLFESAYLDGASHWTAFRKLALPLAAPALASLGIFQFLWVWNDLLVALVFLGGRRPVLTYQISNMVTSLGAGWHLLTAAAFISFLLPLLVFFSLQRYFVRGMLAGSVKG
ncbi:MAG TPA: carbohydrate ABC transporter permease [Aggregatilineales bacterium]|nr:carbohydrate ABC transporter permease [Aggregatilineales bacterium]